MEFAAISKNEIGEIINYMYSVRAVMEDAGIILQANGYKETKRDLDTHREWAGSILDRFYNIRDSLRESTI